MTNTPTQSIPPMNANGSFWRQWAMIVVPLLATLVLSMAGIKSDHDIIMKRLDLLERKSNEIKHEVKQAQPNQ